eukprot:scaffold9809_cov60-Phaeocystis_antarctica.AAC.3
MPASSAHILCTGSMSFSQLHLAPRIAHSCAPPRMSACFSVAMRLDSRPSRAVRRTPTTERGSLKLRIKSRRIVCPASLSAQSAMPASRSSRNLSLDFVM